MKRFLGRLWIGGLVFAAWAWSAQSGLADLFTEIVAFGDSLTDTGNRYASTNNTNPTSPLTTKGDGPTVRCGWSGWLPTLACPPLLPAYSGGPIMLGGGAETNLTGNSTAIRLVATQNQESLSGLMRFSSYFRNRSGGSR